MKKTILLLIVLMLIATFSSCGKSYNNPFEHYYEVNNPSKKWRFSQNSFGLDVNRPNTLKYWERCEKIGEKSSGVLIIEGTEYEYRTNKDTLKLFLTSDITLPTLKYTLIYNRYEQNFPGIFQ